ncbi:MAG TPA: efflux RND transporter periplasmic adaptor subunit [Bryobacteraceae bacterium]
MTKRLLTMVAVLAALAVAGWYGMRAWREISTPAAAAIPTAKVQRGDISLDITARGELRGGNPETLTAPLTGGGDLHITALKTSGEPVKEGDLVLQFDTTEQEFKLKEAEADLAEAEQHIVQARAQRDAEQEEDRYALLKAKADVQLAELDVRKNPILPALVAKQNTLALDNARDHLAQLESNLANRTATNEAGIAIQEAGQAKAETQAKTARENIEAMTLRAHRPGYVSVKQNTGNGVLFFGMTLPLFQVGDTVRPGMAVAEIPDLNNWELGAKVGELDRGHLSSGQPVEVSVIAVPKRPFKGHVKEIGATTGPPWDRHFECVIAMDNPSPELRPGMSATIVVTTDQLRNVLWLPAQALFENDGRTFVYARSGGNFTAKDVVLQRRNETRVVVSGLEEGQEVALANPLEKETKKLNGGALPLPK